ncbi:SAM domain and HD [Entomortierella beljakovae]|nr:SAM domain and HD [Entomortierella beljakovae]
MSPTESSFAFPPSIESRFATSPPTLTSHLHSFSPTEQRSKAYNNNNNNSNNNYSTSSSSTVTTHSVTGPFSTPISTTGASPRPLSFHWEDYQDFEQEDSEDQDEEDSENESDEHEDISMTSRNAYHRQFEGHHSAVRRGTSFGEGGSGGGGKGRRRRGEKDEYENRYDTFRHGIGTSMSDMSDELAKARSKISGATRAMKSMEQELEVMQKNIDVSKVSSASARSAIEENFWRLECLALTIEKDRQDTNKKLQEVNRDCGEAIEAVTNWEVRIDWLEKKVDNTSEYVSELVLSEQECMSFIKMIIQQNQRYSMPAISRATERNIKLLAPPRQREISHPNVQPEIRRPLSPQPQQIPQPLQPQPSVRHIPISWLLDPIMPPKPPEILERVDSASDDSKQERRSTVEPPAELWRDFSRLTTAFETGQTRTTFSPFHRTRSRSTGGGTLLPVSGISSGGSSASTSTNSSGGIIGNISGSSSSSVSNSSGHVNNNVVQNGSVFKSAAIVRRPQVENLSPMPKIFPMVAANKIPVVKRRNQHLAHLPVHSWLQLQFNKTITTPGNLGREGSKKRTTSDINGEVELNSCNNSFSNNGLLSTPKANRVYRRGSFSPLFDRDDSGVYESDGVIEKYINDPIHGHVLLDNDCLRFIDTPQFQRLRDLKQLGSAYYVFPGATHNRFEHSIGTSHLAGELVERFKCTQPELEISESDVKCVKLAGLCHDLGHGPFSHVFDNEFIPRALPGSTWTHEQGSEMMLEYLVDDNNVDIEREELNFIKDLIMGERRGDSQRRGFLFDIVSNKRNSLDVDKYDYIQRDCYNVGFKSSIDCSRLMRMSRVIDDQICWHHKEVYNLYELYHTRFSLFKKVYTHRVGKAVEYMLTDALLAADNVMGISSAIFNGEEYLHLTDDIIRHIERTKESGLEEAKGIIKRIRTRDFYKFVDELLIPREKLGRLTKENVNSAEIVSCQGPNDHLKEEDVIVEFLKNNYAMKDRNPVDSVKFFSKHNHSGSYHIPKEKVSSLIPSEFQENMIRVFVRDSSKIQAVQEAFRRLMSKFYRTSDGTNTLPPSSTSPYFDSRHTTPEITGNSFPVNWIKSRQASPSPSGNFMKRRERSSSPSPARRFKSNAMEIN